MFPKEFYEWVLTMPIHPSNEISVYWHGYIITFSWLSLSKEHIMVKFQDTSTTFHANQFKQDCPSWLEKERQFAQEENQNGS